MNKKRGWAYILAVVAIVMVTLVPGGVGAQEPAPLNPDQAIAAAQTVVDDRVGRGILPQWEGTIVTDPVLYYNTNLEPVVYVLSVEREEEVVGYLIVDRWPRPYPVLEFAALPPPHLRYRKTVQALARGGKVTPDLKHPIYLGPLNYYLRLLLADRQEETDPLWLDLRTGREFTPSQSPSLDTRSLKEQAIAPPDPDTSLSPAAYKLLSGITDYSQFWGTSYGYGFNCYSGCTNTGAACVLSYWDTHGYPNLIGSNWRDDVNWIRTAAGGYCSGDWTYTSIGDIGPAVESFAQHKGYGYFDAPLWYPSQSTYAAYCAEIDANHPVLLHLIGYKGYNHTVAGIGYDTNGSYMIVYDNYYADVPIQYEVQYDETWMNKIAPDNFAPTTSQSLSGTSGDNGWYRSSVQVTLTASDNSGGSGVKLIQYRIDSGSWHTYSSPFTVSGDGSHTVRYKAQDNAGNWESEKQVSVRIDTTAPTGSLTINDGATTTPGVLVRMGPSASDATSGVYRMRLRDAGGSWSDWQSYTSRTFWQLPAITSQSHTVEIQFKDRAGNTSTTYSHSIYLDVYPARPSSAGHRLARSTWGAAPWDKQSANYRLQGTVGQPSMIGILSSANYRLKSGYWAMQHQAHIVYLPLLVRSY